MVGALLIISFLAFTGHGLIRDPDFWWHVRTGEWMLQHQQLPGHDIYTFWGNPNTWTNHEWLSEVLMWLVWSWWGAPGIVLVFSTVTLLGFVFLLLRSEMAKPPYLILGAGMLLGLVAASPIWGPRPQMIEFCLVALELLWLARYLQGQARGWAAIYWLPLVMIVWVNLHGSWPSAFLFLGAAVAAQAWGWLAGRDMVAKRRVIGLLAVSMLCVLALLLTPNGPAELLYPFQTQGSAAQQALIEEWFSPDFHQVFLRPFEAMLFVALVGFMIKRPNLYNSLIALGTLAMALESVRHISLFVLAVAPAMIESYSRIWREDALPFFSRLAQSHGWAASLGRQLQPSAPRPASAALVLLTWLAFAGFVTYSTYNAMQGQAAYDRKDYPVAAAQYIQSHPNECLRIYNQYGWGGYLVYSLEGGDLPARHQAYIFGEAALMGDKHLNEYEAIATITPNWEQMLFDANVDCVLYNTGTPVINALALDPQHWHRAYSDPVATIYERN